MFNCHVCGNTAARNEFVSEVFTIDGRPVLVEHIPAQLCERCGEPTFSGSEKGVGSEKGEKGKKGKRGQS